jgi:uncharacterized Tic20 family protein
MQKSSSNQKRTILLKDNLIRFIFVPLLYTLLAILAIIIPLILWQLKKVDAAPFVSFTRLDGLPFELFGGLISFVLVLIAWLEIIRKEHKNLSTVLPTILGLLVGLVSLFTISESTFNVRFNSDYIAFEKGAKAISAGISPYIHQDSPYVYPPLVGQVMAFLNQKISHISFLQPGNEEYGWQIIFYLFQCCQLFLIILAYFLTYNFGRRIGLKSIPASLIVAALFLFNNSVTRTLVFHQTNLWILNCFLIGFLLQQSFPFISGFAVALGIHIKMYPFILILPWIGMRRWRLLAGTSVGIFTIALIQTNLGRDWTILKHFVEYLGNVSKPAPYRNNSINSIVYNFFKIPNILFGTSFDYVDVIVKVITLCIGIWFLIRFIQREKLYFQLNKSIVSEKQYSWNSIFRFYGHSMDAIALGLLISPSVYEHHFIVAIPIALWAITIRRLDKPVLTGISIFLIFCIPTFDLFLVSFHRLVGLLMLIQLINPKSTKNYFAPDKIMRYLKN